MALDSLPMRAHRVLAAFLLTAAVAGCSSAGPADPVEDASSAPTGGSTGALAGATPEAPSAAGSLGLVEGWGPTAAELERAATLVARLSTPELAGQVMVVPWSGTRAPTALLRRYRPGGFIWFSDNVVSPAQVRRVNRTLRRASDREWPLFLGIDQEGGTVARLDRGVTRLPSFMTAGAARAPRLTRAVAEASGRELRALGFTANFAPVADVTAGPTDPTIGSRAASSSPEQAGIHALASARGLADAGLVAPLKHFPGHGSVRADSHATLPRQPRGVAALRRTDLRPFADAVRAGTSAVMTGHLDVRAVDPGVPASLSRRVVHGLLREELGFEGLVVTDSLSMGAVTRSHTPERAAVQALRAGSDVLLMPGDVPRVHAGLVRAVRGGTLPRARLEQAAARQVALLLHHRTATGAPPGTARRAALAWSRAAVTVTGGPCRGRLVGRAVAPVGDRSAVRAFVPAARAAGLRVTPRGSRVAFLRPGGAAHRAPVTVAVDAPWVLARTRSRVEVAAYGDTPLAMRAVAEVLAGQRRAPGRLPVPVAGSRRRGC